jgi:hypothetical protein
MRLSGNPDRCGLSLWRRVLGCAAFVAVVLSGVVLGVAQQQGQAGVPAQSPPAQGVPAQAQAAQTVAKDGTNTAVPVASPAPGGSAVQSIDTANGQRKRQIADEGAQLLKLATDLKAEVDKTTKDTLSLAVIRKADEIEKLAHDVKEKTRTAAGAN